MARKKPRTKAGKQRKVHKVMGEFKRGRLHSGRSRRVVRSRRQAVAIAMSMSGQSRRGRRRRK